MKKSWNQLWMDGAKEKLPWPSFDKMTKGEVKNDFENMMKWMAAILVVREKGYSFELTRVHGPQWKRIHLTQGRKRNANKLTTS